jgi:glycine oxidase
MSNHRPYDVLIVGGGVIGWSVAYHTAKAGLSVCVVDPHKRGGHASNVAAGLICPSPQLTKPTPFAKIALASVQRFPSLRDELKENSGIDIQLDACGTLRIATSEEQAKHQQKRLPAQQQLGINLHWLEATDVQKMEPAITVPLFGAVYGPDESQITAARLIKAYMVAAMRLGATHEETVCQRLLTKGNSVTGIATKRGELHAKQVVIASGTWTLQLTAALNIHLPIEPERGQIAVISPIAPALRHIIFGEQIYLALKQNKSIIIGGIKDRGQFNESPSVSGVSELLRKGMSISAYVAEADVKRMLAGVRPRTPDGLPIIGPIPGWEGVSIAAGHNSNGLLLSPITGQIITSQLTGQPTPIDQTPYLPSRFSSERDNRVMEERSDLFSSRLPRYLLTR